MAPRPPSLTPYQISQYFNHVKLPPSVQATALDLASQDEAAQLSLLAVITRHQLCAVPFENLDLHYASVKGISLDPEHLFAKVVERNAGRGGYCMQNNAFFATVLRSLGYNVMSAGGRVSKSLDNPTASNENPELVEFGGFSHQVNLVTIGSERYLVDVGFGASGPAGPRILKNGYTCVNTGTKDKVASSMRLTKGFVGNNTAKNTEQELWVYSTKFGAADNEDKPWFPCYCFAETEFFRHDFEIMSNWVSTNRSSIFLQMVICQKFIMSDDGNDLIGDITLHNGAVKERRFGDNVTLAEFKSEDDRTGALEKYLGVKLSQAEKQGIVGFPSAIS